jgi:polyisoprenoid-binding protein YceI
MKNLLFILGLLASFTAHSQNYILEGSKIRFFSHAPLEDIEAITTEGQGAINASKSTFSFRIPINTFQFEKELMQEHFNENYLESAKYPNGTFKGKIEGNYDLKKDGEYAVVAKGDLEIHGVTKPREIQATIKVQNGAASLYSKFKVKVADHNIEIPTLVFQNIAEEVEVTIESKLKAYEKQ